MAIYYAGIDLGGTRMRAALADSEGKMVRRSDALTERGLGSERIVERMIEVVGEAMGGERAGVACLGVGAPGPLDARTGVLFHPVNLTTDDVPLKELLEDRLGLPVRVHNDANAAALGEWLFGGHGQTQHLIYVTVSTGVGAGIISHGRLIDGFNTTAGEIGHTVVDPNGPPCGCGNRGCVEAICSGSSIARAATAALGTVTAGRMMTLAGGKLDGVTAEVVAQAAREGDELASRIFFHAADTLGIAVVNLIHLFSPEIVIIGGGVAEAGDLLFGPVRERVLRTAMSLPALGVRIRPPGLGQDAGLVGAIALAMGAGIDR